MFFQSWFSISIFPQTIQCWSYTYKRESIYMHGLRCTNGVSPYALLYCSWSRLSDHTEREKPELSVDRLLAKTGSLALSSMSEGRGGVPLLVSWVWEDTIVTITIHTLSKFQLYTCLGAFPGLVICVVTSYYCMCCISISTVHMYKLYIHIFLLV